MFTRVLLTTVVTVIVLAILIGFLIVAGSINKKIHQDSEKELISRALQENNVHFVQINDKRLSIAVFGNKFGNHKIVMLSGAGTASPIYDFKALIDRLKDRYSLIVVEKTGYGFSESSTNSRDIDVILSETRTALLESGQKGPYVLVPHSMSGLEALYWATQYPDEVEAIVGLDMAMPQAYETRNLVPPQAAITLLGALARTGLPRLLPKLTADQSPAIKSKRLSSTEIKVYRALFYRNFMDTDVRNEINTVNANARKVNKAGLPSVRMLQFVSNGQGTGFKKKEWRLLQEQLKKKQGNSQVKYCEAPHYIHNYCPEEISECIKNFLQ